MLSFLSETYSSDSKGSVLWHLLGCDCASETSWNLNADTWALLRDVELESRDGLWHIYFQLLFLTHLEVKPALQLSTGKPVVTWNIVHYNDNEPLIQNCYQSLLSVYQMVSSLHLVSHLINLWVKAAIYITRMNLT